jgi:hypothetical protein
MCYLQCGTRVFVLKPTSKERYIRIIITRVETQSSIDASNSSNLQLGLLDVSNLLVQVINVIRRLGNLLNELGVGHLLARSDGILESICKARNQLGC